MTWKPSEKLSAHAGLAYEREFDGKVKSSLRSASVKTPELRGSSGIGELGFSLTPSKDLPLSFDIGVQGYKGKRDGVNGNVQLRFEF